MYDAGINGVRRVEKVRRIRRRSNPDTEGPEGDNMWEKLQWDYRANMDHCRDGLPREYGLRCVKIYHGVGMDYHAEMDYCMEMNLSGTRAAQLAAVLMEELVD
jgi:hypothetical protein